MAVVPTRRTTFAALAVLSLGVATVAAASSATAQPGGHRHTVSKASSWTAHADRSTAVPTKDSVSAKVWLAPRNEAALTALATAVSDPSSAQYGHYLSESAYRAQFAPTSAQVSAVESWLKGAGLHVQGTGPDNHYVSVSGSATAIDAAFTAGVRQFTVNGASVLGSTSDVTVPDALAGDVLAVSGLDTMGHQVQPGATTGPAAKDTPSDKAKPAHDGDPLGPPPGYVNAGPCNTAYGVQVDKTDPKFDGQRLPYAVCGYTAAQFRSAYGVTQSGLTGKGVTVAITDAFAAPTILSDANTLSRRQGDQKFRPGQFTQSNDTNYDPQNVADCGGNGWFGEETLDVEAVHGVAQDANVAYYGAASCYDDDLMASIARAVSDDKASLISNSWGEPVFQVIDGVKYITITPDLVDAYESIFKQGAIQGIGVYFSSGDDGDDAAAWGVKGTDYPTSDPWVTSVGGTSLAINANGRRAFETGWGTNKFSLTNGAWTSVGFLYGAGGGCSDVFTKPAYQKGQTSCATRGVPDVAMDADPTTGMLIGETQVFDLPTKFGQGTRYGEYRIGGTSLASPLMAGLNAATQQGRMRIGFANPSLYYLHSRTADFYDVTPQGDMGNVRVDYANGLNAADGTLTSIRTFDQDASLKTKYGWDQVTGVGSPTAAYIRSLHKL